MGSVMTPPPSELAALTRQLGDDPLDLAAHRGRLLAFGNSGRRSKSEKKGLEMISLRIVAASQPCHLAPPIKTIVVAV